MKKKLLTYILLLILSELYGTSYNFTRLDNTKGLSNNQIESIFRDSRGFMWFGTNFGLNRYDGYQVKVYKSDKNDSSSLITNSIAEIQEDYKGNLWLRGNPEYVVYDILSEKFIRNLSPILSPMGVNFSPSIVEIDQEKNFYFYFQDIGIYKYNPKSEKLTSFLQGKSPTAISKGTIVSIRHCRDGFWVLFQSGLLERYNEKTNRVDFSNTYMKECSLGATIPKSLFIDREGCPWVYPGIADKGVQYFDFNQMEWTYFGGNPKDFRNPRDILLATDFVRDLAQEQNGLMWIATDHGGINLYNKKTRNLTVLLNDQQNPNSVSQNSVITLYADPDGIMWAGTYKNGVSYYHPGMFKFEKSPLFFYHHPQLENKDCNNLYEDTRGNLWIGTNGSGLLRYNIAAGSFQLFRNDKNNPASISSDIIISSLEDKSGVLWFGTFMGGLNRYNGSGFQHFQPNVNNQNSLSNKSIYGLAEDDLQNLWIGTLGGGVDKLDAQRTNFSRHDIGNAEGLSSNYILSMYSKNPQLIYLCTSNGIDMLDTKKNTISPVLKDKNLLNKLSDQITINALSDSRNLLWIATDNGINVYNAIRKEIQHINAANGLPSEQVVSLVEDNFGNIWAGTRNGLAFIRCKFIEKTKNYDFSIVSFDENDGLVSTIFNQNAVFKNKAGIIYFGSTKGYIVFDPRNISFNKQIPKPRITGLVIGNEHITPGMKYKNRIILDQSIVHKNKLVLKAGENNLSIQFSAMSYIHPEKNNYKYQLIGLDNDWTYTKNGIVNYSNLNHGDYKLVIYASNNDNVWSTEPLTLEISITPPFWLSWWAFLFYFFMALFIVWFIVTLNLRKQQHEFENEKRISEAKQLHEMDEMKFRFFTNISHEFRTPLSLILNPTEKLLGEVNSEDQKNLLTIIERNANGLLQLVNQLLDFRKLDVQKDKLNVSVGDVVTFVKDICYSFTELANKKSVNFSFSTSISELRMEFDDEKLRKIIHNLLSNAFKFTPDNGKIDLTINLVQQINEDKKTLKIAVSDSGIGISDKDLGHIFDRFYRVENKENRYQTGTGVGLHIVSEYMKLHNGDISVESKPGKGSTFTVSIPVKHVLLEEVISKKDPIEQPESETTEIPDDHRNKLPLMLIVDDNEDFLKFIASIFTESYRMITAVNGEKALKLTLEKMPDLIISDVMMPVMDGYEFCRQVKNDIRISHIPIILLTAKTGEENKFKGLSAGAEDYIAKPFKMDLLQLKVARIIERQRQQHDHFKKKIDITLSEVEVVSMDEKFVKKAVATIEANLNNSEFLVEDLCREMGMSRVYFYKKILALTDKTPSELIRFIRLKRAATLLEKSQLFVNEVAYRVGFNDPKNFRKYFKDEFGLSPNEYKKTFEK
ncbi:MAG TPA: two-component regulator propeller domain-containing protein [Paludibacteraceae bacterium]|nr:two-component regulator propeller domain-containing protein [Paludibacteraceae bacterium]